MNLRAFLLSGSSLCHFGLSELLSDHTTGKEWIKQTLLSAGLFPVFVSTIVFLINFIAMYYHASRAIPFGTMVCFDLKIPVSTLYRENERKRKRREKVPLHSSRAGCRGGHLSLRDCAADAGGGGAGPQPDRRCGQPLPRQPAAPPHSRKEMVTVAPYL